MFTAKKLNFCKSEDCPASQELLDFQNGDIELDRGSSICAHLAFCEFCAAEVEFYSRYPQQSLEQEEDADLTSEIPQPLYELAEAILKNKDADISSLNFLIK
ncbi:MAG TPA: hypothetical protein PKA82_06195 [Pyrinomonadaceae bacterium]|nr:hypothetical protein [Pyrinomonadaceae bacterium]